MTAQGFLADTRGSTAAEFAMVVPVMLLFFFGIIDGGRYAWAMNRLEKAVQMGTRTAVVTSLVATDLNTIDYVGNDCPTVDSSGNPTTKPIQVGDRICAAAFTPVICSKAGGSVDCGGGTVDTSAFDRILARMRVVDPSIRDSEVIIRYSASGLGYAGDPATDADGNPLSDAAPIVTVGVERPQMRMLFLLGGRIPLPSFSYSQTLEDGLGTGSF